MVSTLNLEEKYNRVRRNFCFYLDIQEHGLARSISRRLQDMGLQQEVFLTSRVTHVVRDPAAGAPAPAAAARCSAGRARADAMLERVRPRTLTDSPQPATRLHPAVVQLTVQKAISLLDKLYDTFFTAPRKSNVTLFSKHFIKIEFLDKVCRPVFKEFDEWPEISLEPDPPKKKKTETPVDTGANDINQNITTAGQKMTRKSRPRIKEKEDKEPKGGYCEMCNTDYADAALHRRSPHHLAFVRDHTNFLALDSLISSGADVTTFLDKATPINGERRSLRKMCNGDVEPPKTKRSKRSQSPDSTVNGDQSPRRNGGLEDEKRHNTRCSKRAELEDRQYYKVVGVSTKLRSSGGFAARKKESPPTCNGAKPLVVKFRKVRRSELSVLSDEAEQFMFPKRASSSSSTSSEDDDKPEELSPRRKSPLQPPPSIERQRLARPVALKEESSEEDVWPEDKRRRKRRGGPVAKRGRRLPLKSLKTPVVEPPPEPEPPAPPEEPEPPPPAEEVCPLREEPVEKCMKWEDGKLQYTPAVEQLEFAFESVPRSEPWFETFKRQDQDRVMARNVPKYFALYTKSPKLPYEIGQLPPLKPNCCPLSDLVKREDKPGPSRSYGTRGMKKQKFRKRTAAVVALEAHPRKSPREHASTLAILGSAGLLHRRKHADDAKSTASEDTISDVASNIKLESLLSETQEASERLQQFLSEVFEDAADYEISEEAMEGEPAVTTSTNALDMSSLVSECEDCDIIRNEIKEADEANSRRARGRRAKFKKKNRTGWPNKKKTKKDSRANSLESDKKAESSLDRSSAEPPDDETTQDTISEEDPNLSETEDKTLDAKSEDESDKTLVELENDKDDTQEKCESVEEDTSKFDKSDHKRPSRSSASEAEDKSDSSRGKRPSRSSASETDLSTSENDKRKKKRALAGLLLQPVVRVARVDPNAARRLRSAAKQRSSRLR